MKKDRWFDWAEYALLLGSGAGAVASVVTQQALLAAAPLSLLAAAGLISRRQLQLRLSQSQSVMISVNSRLDQRLQALQEQLEALPTHDQLSALRQSVIAQNKQDILSLSQVIEHTRKKLTTQIAEQEFPELRELQQELIKLQERYTELFIDLKDIRSRCQQLSDTSRVEATETTVTKLETDLMQLRVHLDALGANAKNNYTGLQDKLTYLNQQVQQMTTEEHQSLLKGEVHELIKTVSGMVSREEFLKLTAQLNEISANKLIATELQTQNFESAEQLRQRLEQLEQQIVTAAEPAEPLDVAQLHERLDATDEQMKLMTEAVLEAVAETIEPLRTESGSADSQWLVDFETSGGRSSGQQALEQLLGQARKRLVLVWPWADHVALDDRLLRQFQQVLERNCRLEIGWCHQGDNREPLLLRSIRQRWCHQRSQQLKQALNQLLPLKQNYPELFSFKILGTTENFAVCDSEFALVGMQALSTQTSLFPTVNLKLRTRDTAVIQALTQRFENPVIDTDDSGAYFNRGITRYDIRNCAGAIDDFTQVLTSRPSAAAYNCRGVAWCELNDYAKALQDFGHAIQLDPRLFEACCNRGVLRIAVRDYEGALNDLEAAASLRPHSPIPYFYQGQALQSSGNGHEAIRRFSLAIDRQPEQALPYCYRGIAYQKQGQRQQAISDLETAARLLRAAGDITNLNQVIHRLETLQQGPRMRTAA